MYLLQQLAICFFHKHFGFICAFKGAYLNEIAHYADIQIYSNKPNIRICGCADVHFTGTQKKKVFWVQKHYLYPIFYLFSVPIGPELTLFNTQTPFYMIQI